MTDFFQSEAYQSARGKAEVEMPKVKQFLIRVRVLDKDDNIIRSKRIDFYDNGHKDWLTRLTVWAVSNKYVVEISDIRDLR